MSRARSWILIVGALAVIALCSVALVASKTTPPVQAEGPCLEYGTRRISSTLGGRGELECLRHGESPARPLSLVDQDTAAYWWFGGVAAAVLTTVLLVVTPSIGTRRQSRH